MHLTLVAGNQAIEILRTTPTATTFRALRGDREHAFQEYAWWVRGTACDEIDHDEIERHLRLVAAVLTFANARFAIY